MAFIWEGVEGVFLRLESVTGMKTRRHTHKTGVETVKTGVETQVSQQLLETGVKTGEQLLSFSVNTTVSTAY